MLKRAMMAGLNAAGINVHGPRGGEHARDSVPDAIASTDRRAVRCASPPTIPRSVVVRFFDNDGTDITEDAQRKIERLFQREDYRRVFAEEIGDIGFPPRALEDYTVALESTVEIETIAASRFKVVRRLRLRRDLAGHAERARASSAPTCSP